MDLSPVSFRQSGTAEFSPLVTWARRHPHIIWATQADRDGAEVLTVRSKASVDARLWVVRRDRDGVMVIDTEQGRMLARAATMADALDFLSELIERAPARYRAATESRPS